MKRGVLEYLERMTTSQLLAFMKQKDYRIRTDERRRIHGSISETLMQSCALMIAMDRVKFA